MAETTANHWPTELLIEIGNDIATREDLAELSLGELWEFAKTCEMPELAPDECVPCYAHTMALEQTEQAQQALSPDVPDVPEYEPPADAATEALDLVEEEPGFPRLEDLMESKPPWAQENRHSDPVQEFARSVGYLNDLVQEMVSGPPIPPREVTLDELAVLVVAAQRWIKITEAQGIELAPAQQTLLDATKALVARLHHG